MKNLGRLGSVIRVAGCSWLVLLACGGISERSAPDDGSSGSASGGSTAGKPSRGGSTSTSHAGTQSVAGTAATTAGTASMTMPTPTPAGEPAPCYNDTDCPVNSCGGEVCNWNKPHPNPVGEKVFVCNPAGTAPKSQDGWCTTDANCKCLGRGAKCLGVHCTFTRASDADR